MKVGGGGGCQYVLRSEQPVALFGGKYLQIQMKCVPVVHHSMAVKCDFLAVYFLFLSLSYFFRYRKQEVTNYMAQVVPILLPIMKVLNSNPDTGCYKVPLELS
jgi:hypothetical protein